MITRLFSAALRGVEAQEVEVEVEVNARGADKPVIIVVGLPDAAATISSWSEDNTRDQKTGKRSRLNKICLKCSTPPLLAAEL